MSYALYNFKKNYMDHFNSQKNNLNEGSDTHPKNINEMKTAIFVRDSLRFSSYTYKSSILIFGLGLFFCIHIVRIFCCMKIIIT